MLGNRLRVSAFAGLVRGTVWDAANCTAQVRIKVERLSFKLDCIGAPPLVPRSLGFISCYIDDLAIPAASYRDHAVNR